MSNAEECMEETKRELERERDIEDIREVGMCLYSMCVCMYVGLSVYIEVYEAVCRQIFCSQNSSLL